MSQEGIKALGFCSGLLLLGIYGLYRVIKAAVIAIYIRAKGKRQ